MFNVFKKVATAAAEHATGQDFDGDGKVGISSKSAHGQSSSQGSSFDLASAASLISSFALSPSSDGTVDLDDGYAMPTSSCTGNKKALLVGINYFGSKSELRGCINDVQNVKSMITQKFGFEEDAAHMLVLTDDQQGRKSPTRENIIHGMKWLIEGAKDGDSLFFHFSGHGGTQTDKDGDEADGKDETIIPVDYLTKGMIVDDDIHSMLVAPLPKGVRITAVMDCCHSGSVFDLPYSYKVDGSLEIIEIDNRKEAINAAIAAGKALIDGAKLEAATHGANAIMNIIKMNQPQGEKKPVVIKKSLADVIQFSGCRDEQCSADANIDGKSTGAMSWALITCIEEFGMNQTYTQLLGNIRSKLAAKYSQVPQMSTGHKMNMSGTKFIM
jgi:hypothetical protein